MCRGSGMPGSSTWLSGNSGIVSATPPRYPPTGRAGGDRPGGRTRPARKLGIVLRRLDLTSAAAADLRRALPRAEVDVHAALAAVTPLVEDVASRGYPAVRDATLRFDGVDVPEPCVPAAALAEALDALD